MFVYQRKLQNKSYFVICNFKNKEIKFKVPQGLVCKTSSIAISNYDEINTLTLQNYTLKPFEATVFEIEE